MTNIYALIDPRTSECRYVGKADNMEARLRGHIRPCHLKENWPRINWIKKLLSLGLTPEMIHLETVPQSEWVDAERWWIAYMKGLGARLTNATIGGDGIVIYGRKLSDARKLALSIMNSGVNHPQYGKQRSAETKLKVSLAGMGRPASAETRRKRSIAMSGERNHQYGISISKEVREKISKTLTGRVMPDEIRAKISKANSIMTDELRAHKSRASLSKSPEVRRAGAIKSWESRSRVMSEETKQKIRDTKAARRK